MHAFPRTREEALGSVLEEVRAEQATTLGRVGRRIDALIDQLHALEQTLAGTRGLARRRLLAEHEAARKEAELYLWYLTVQREAMGITLNDQLELFYPIPHAIRE